MMQVFICRICGDAYVGSEKPSHCPFCGAPDAYLFLSSDYTEPEIPELSEVSKKNLEESLGLEVSNVKFYKCISDKAPDVEGREMFKRLSKVEGEHASVIRKTLGMPKEAVEGTEECSGDYQENLKEFLSREESATKRYSKFLSEATEPRVKEIFKALMKIESSHIELAKQRLD